MIFSNSIAKNLRKQITILFNKVISVYRLIFFFRQKAEVMYNKGYCIYIQKYKDYVSFLENNRHELLDCDKWDILFDELTLLTLHGEYTLDDYRSKTSTDNILNLYARKADTCRPCDETFKRYDEMNGLYGVMRSLFKKRFKFIDNVVVAEEDEDIQNGDKVEEDDRPLNLPEKILPESVVTLDFTPEAIWEAYLLKTTDYYIGQRWHGGYHEMTIPANIEELKEFKPWKEDEKLQYEKFIEETEIDFEPQITIKGNVATIEHIAVFFHNRISQCTAKAYYNAVDKKIEKFEFDNVDLFKFSPRYKF